MRNDILERKDEILQWIDENQSKAFMCRCLKCKSTTLNSYLDKMGIKYEGKQGWSKGKQIERDYISAEEYIKREHVSSHKLKNKLIRDGIKENKCEICGISVWLGAEIPLELHHKDGNHFNNEFDNLQVLCPNCHSIQEIHKREKAPRNDIEYRSNKCIDCGKAITRRATRCEECYRQLVISNSHKKEISREELKKLIRTTPFLQIGKKLGVNDNTIRKWCDSFGLPRKVSEIKQISDEDWKKI